MISVDQVIDRLKTAFPQASLTRVENPSPAAQHSLLVEPDSAREIAQFLRDDGALLFDYCSNVSGVDWPERVVEEVVTSTEVVGGETKEVKTTVKHTKPGYLEAVYHLYSVRLKHGPLVLRMRTADRADRVQVPSLTPVWKSAELQEREVYDLYGIRFIGHPDLRRLLLWDGFEGHPMRKDFVMPDEDVLPETASTGPKQLDGGQS